MICLFGAGRFSNCTCFIWDYGQVDITGSNVSDGNYGIREAMWIVSRKKKGNPMMII